MVVAWKWHTPTFRGRPLMAFSCYGLLERDDRRKSQAAKALNLFQSHDSISTEYSGGGSDRT